MSQSLQLTPMLMYPAGQEVLILVRVLINIRPYQHPYFVYASSESSVESVNEPSLLANTSAKI